MPTGYREGAEALGMTMGYSLRKVVLKSALPGIVTGLLLAMAIACGETAPLIYTAGFSNTLPSGLTHAQFPYLTYVVFTFYDQPNVAGPLPGLRRRADPGGDRAAAAGRQPHRRGPDPAPCRGGAHAHPLAAADRSSPRRRPSRWTWPTCIAEPLPRLGKVTADDPRSRTAATWRRPQHRDDDDKERIVERRT